MTIEERETFPWTPAQVAEARGWVADCMWREEPEDLDELTDAQVVRGVDRHFDGGMTELVRNASLDEREIG